MQRAVIFATGSPIIVDLEESLHRAGIILRAGVANRPAHSYLSDAALAVPVTALTDDITACPFLVALFSPGNRQLAAREAEELGFRVPLTLIDPSVAQPRVLRPGPGVYINAGCSLGADSDFGGFVFINRGATIGHHARLEAFVSIGPGAVLGGQVSVGKGSLIGAGAVILPRIAIGVNAVVGAGAVVTRNVDDHTSVIGNPARVLQTGIAGYGGMTVN